MRTVMRLGLSSVLTITLVVGMLAGWPDACRGEDIPHYNPDGSVNCMSSGFHGDAECKAGLRYDPNQNTEYKLANGGPPTDLDNKGNKFSENYWSSCCPPERDLHREELLWHDSQENTSFLTRRTGFSTAYEDYIAGYIKGYVIQKGIIEKTTNKNTIGVLTADRGEFVQEWCRGYNDGAWQAMVDLGSDEVNPIESFPEGKKGLEALGAADGLDVQSAMEKGKEIKDPLLAVADSDGLDSSSDHQSDKKAAQNSVPANSGNNSASNSTATAPAYKYGQEVTATGTVTAISSINSSYSGTVYTVKLQDKQGQVYSCDFNTLAKNNPKPNVSQGAEVTIKGQYSETSYGFIMLDKCQVTGRP